MARSGTVLMECVLVLPVLVTLIFAIAQFALIWYAQIMTHYAAYNAARAALVYNPAEYSDNGVFKSVSGPCWEAAVRSLAWMSSSAGNSGPVAYSHVAGWGLIPNSSQIANQVRINQSESEEQSDPPCVKVCVDFEFPLLVPVLGRMIGCFVNGSDDDAIMLHAYSLHPKPWSTARYPRRP